MLDARELLSPWGGADRAELAVRCSDEAGDVGGVVALRRVDHDRGAGLRIRERVVVIEVFESGGHRGDRQAVRVEAVGLARDLQAARVLERRGVDEGRLARRAR